MQKMQYGVIGDPIGHSLSPLLHQSAFDALGIPARYRAYHVTEDRLDSFMRFFRNDKKEDETEDGWTEENWTDEGWTETSRARQNLADKNWTAQGWIEQGSANQICTAQNGTGDRANQNWTGQGNIRLDSAAQGWAGQVWAEQDQTNQEAPKEKQSASFPMCGLSVTLPHKKKMFQYIDKATPQAALAGAINTLYWEKGQLTGHNTDIEGFLAPLHGHAELDSAVILGAGGAAAAVLAGLLSLPNIKKILLCARRREQAEELCQTVQENFRSLSVVQDTFCGRSADAAPKVEISILDYAQREQAECSLAVNTIPASLGGNAFSPLESFRGVRMAYDLLYAETPFLTLARRSGVQTVNGLPMFIGQGNAQFRLWTGQDLPECAIAAVNAAI